MLTDKLERLLDELPEDQQIIITRVFSSRKKDKSTQVWVVEVGKCKSSSPHLMAALAQVRDQCNGRTS